MVDGEEGTKLKISFASRREYLGCLASKIPSFLVTKSAYIAILSTRLPTRDA